jgi:hypothetical protein
MIHNLIIHEPLQTGATIEAVVLAAADGQYLAKGAVIPFGTCAVLIIIVVHGPVVVGVVSKRFLTQSTNPSILTNQITFQILGNRIHFVFAMISRVPWRTETGIPGSSDEAKETNLTRGKKGKRV